MKKSYKLKIVCMLCMFTVALGSCKKNELTEENGLAGNHKNLAIHGDGRWDLLGYGYDMTGELFASANASDAAIIDVDRFNTDYPNRINTPTDTYGYFATYSGATASDYIKEINTKETYGLTVSAGEKEKNTFGSGNFSKANENQSTYTYNSKYSYSSFESRVRIKSINFTDDATLDILRNYLTPLFIANLSNYSADALVERYGTHVLLGLSIGGRLKYEYRGSVIKETTAEKKLRAIKAGFSIGVDKIFGISFSSDVSKDEKTTISNETTEKSFIGTYYGGTNSGTSFSSDAAGNTSQSVNLAGWQQSITVNNATLVNINKSVPLYEFITDPIKKEQVRLAVDKYISDRQVKELGEVPIYRYFNSANGDHLYSQGSPAPGGYVDEGIGFYAFKNADNLNTVPIYRYYSPQTGDHLFSEGSPAPAGYVSEGIGFYAYSSSVANSVPIYRYYNPNNNDHYFSKVNITPSGYVSEGIGFYALN
ncbi:MAC/perforin domain-containing protein [Pedobacter sp. N23S346]|uniref:MAC/perforin domain-containing protein n=1 Tax=Pedobacter sp. N23S346 TaxID=3402750 RepID=UPI003AC01243